eukprot:g27364.t1
MAVCKAIAVEVRRYRHLQGPSLQLQLGVNRVMCLYRVEMILAAPSMSRQHLNVGQASTARRGKSALKQSLLHLFSCPINTKLMEPLHNCLHSEVLQESKTSC